MERTLEEWQKLFPVLELYMDKNGLTIMLADEKASLKVTLPDEMVDSIVAKWKELQDGTAAEPIAFGHHYTGGWKVQEIWPPSATCTPYTGQSVHKETGLC
jgi:hypothetical protein